MLVGGPTRLFDDINIAEKLDLDNRILKNSVFILRFVDKYTRGSVVSVVCHSKMFQG